MKTNTRAAAVAMRVASMSEPPEMLLRADCGRAFFLCAPQIVVFERQGADALAGRRENRVAESRSERRNGGFASPAPGTLAGHDHRLHARHVGQTEHRLIMEIRLLDLPVLERDLAVERRRGAENDAAFGLQFDAERSDHMAGIDRRYHPVHAHLAISVDR